MLEQKGLYKLGIDIGSTTAKLVLLDEENRLIFSRYERHNANAAAVVKKALDFLEKDLHLSEKDAALFRISPAITGSVGMGFAESLGVPFIQEVVAATTYARNLYPQARTLIDIGGEDAKIVYLHEDGSSDLRMNGNCAGGTGAFIDQMAILLGVPVEELSVLAEESTAIHPIASRCGVFSKTDVQNLIARNVSRSDIAASIFHAVAVQTVTTLSHGCEIEAPVLLCGGPLSFIPSLRRAFARYLQQDETGFLLPQRAELVPAHGTALLAADSKDWTLRSFCEHLESLSARPKQRLSNVLPRLFADGQELEQWRAEKLVGGIRYAREETPESVFLGIDSGSTTTKIVAIDRLGRIVYEYYRNNEGNPIETVRAGLERWAAQCREAGIEVRIDGSCVTGYGEDLIKNAFKLEHGTIETIAHYLAARRIQPEVSFVLDIGGQDMKAIFVEKGLISRMELNEACSSGCGSFIETFARSLGYTVEDFSRLACLAEQPCDLGTRCTVFMNSKVKQVLREGASVGDISAGLAYSVVKNCLFKVLKLRDAGVLGSHIVVQGGTMRNDAVVRALELLTGKQVSRSRCPELMGAYGCALFAQAHAGEHTAPVWLSDLARPVSYTRKNSQCHGCENRCFIQRYHFDNGNNYVSGNKCERIFSNRGADCVTGENIYPRKYELLFHRAVPAAPSARKIGIPRCLNFYEEYPFWHTLFVEAGLEPVLSAPSTFVRYESCAHDVMSDNICFPAKLVHSHIYDLIGRGVERIFMPYVVFEKLDGKDADNSFNCPIVSGYSDVVRSVTPSGIPIDSPSISFKKEADLRRGCTEYLRGLGIETKRIGTAVDRALEEQRRYEQQLVRENRAILEKSRAEGRICILLAGRPYHSDPLIQHKLSEMIASLGVDVISDDIVRGDDSLSIRENHLVRQWAYVNRLLKAATWAARCGDEVHFVEMTSFGCGPDAFLVDEIRDILHRAGKSLTLLKIDDVNNIGSIRLRVRSLVENLKHNRQEAHVEKQALPFVDTPPYQAADRKRTILVPYFTDFISPLIPPVFERIGYNMVALPPSDGESAELGLKYANNEVCYPATLIVGDVIKALSSGKYNLDETAVIITQTGGQCRATNYLGLIKKAMIEAGYGQVPVLSFAPGSSKYNEQPGFRIPWMKILPMALAVILFSDCLAQFYYATLAREEQKGEAGRLRNFYQERAKALIATDKSGALYDLIAEAARDFDRIPMCDRHLPKVGIVGEIFLKFNSFAHKDVVNYLARHDVEVLPPLLLKFFTQSFVNRKQYKRAHVENDGIPDFVADILYALVCRKIDKANRKAAAFRYFKPFTDIFEDAEMACEAVSLSAQFGEGWLLPGEVIAYAREGVNNVVSLQPFGCIANHVISKGIEKRIKTLYPQMNLLSLDFDSGVSDVNVTNRLLLFANNLK